MRTELSTADTQEVILVISNGWLILVASIYWFFIGKGHHGLLEDFFFQARSMWYLPNISRGGKKPTENELLCLWAVAQKTSRKHQLFFEISDFTVYLLIVV